MLNELNGVTQARTRSWAAVVREADAAAALAADNAFAEQSEFWSDEYADLSPTETQAGRAVIPSHTIARKREGAELSAEEIGEFMRGYVRGEIPDFQMAAMAMAICWRGMSVAETAALTDQMVRSGRTLQWNSPTPKVDKHSTGGLGDKVSLVLAPLLACCDLQVPKISGRGLGITGGTLDKLESIPGLRTELTLDEIQRQTQSIGCVICAATQELAPADRQLYRLRHVTATVESIPLITASILSKKLAESLDALVLDVKFGSGAFMATQDDARQLAQMLVEVGRQLGVSTTALLSDMHQPLGRMVGNAVEVNEAVQTLSAQAPPICRRWSSNWAPSCCWLPPRPTRVRPRKHNCGDC